MSRALQDNGDDGDSGGDGDDEDAQGDKVSQLVSKGYRTELPQTRWLKTTRMYSVTVLEARSLKSVSLAKIKVSVDCTSSRGLRRGSVLCLFQFLVAAGTPWLVPTSLQSSGSTSLNYPLLHLHASFSCVCACMGVVKFPCLSLMKTFIMVFRGHLDNPAYLPPSQGP